MRIITYAIDPDTNLVVSRFDSRSRGRSETGFALPILDYDGMLPENSFATVYLLERSGLFGVPSGWLNGLTWTKKIDKAWKNLHREFWGMKPLPMNRAERRALALLKEKVCIPEVVE